MTTIRAWHDDWAAVEALLAAVWGDDPTLNLFAGTHGPDRNEPLRFRRSLCAVDGDALAGVGTLWQHGLHPAGWRVTIHVAAPWRRQGIGTRLLQALRELAPVPKPLGSGTRETDRAGCGFLAAHGFAPVMRTRLGVCEPADLPAGLLRELDEAAGRVQAAGYQLVTLPEATRRGVSLPEIARLHVALYWEAHTWDRPRPVSETEAEELFLAPDDLLPEAMHLVLAGRMPVAVASLRPGAPPGEVELGWAGTTVAGDGTDLADAVLGCCLAQARANGWRLRVEADEADAWLWPFVHRLPVRWDDDWLNFRVR